MRSGSSFLGEIFNNHEDAFYIFEPLYGTKHANQTMTLLKNNFNCEFMDQKSISILWQKIYYGHHSQGKRRIFG